jgi:uncharacterized pyridoxamine 5'-phosphate oxidase family protein
MNKSNKNIMQIIKSSEEILNGKMDKDINLLIGELNNSNNIKINKYVFEIYSILNSEKNIILLLNSTYSDFTSIKGNKENIVEFIYNI